MLLNDTYGMVPGLTTARETYETEFRWGSQWQGVIVGGIISGSARDSSNSPTYELRAGLLLGQVLSTGQYTNYSPTATDGSEVATGVLMEALRMQDFEGNNVNKFYGILVGGPVQASKLQGLDLQARAQMANNFIFDDIGNLPGNHWFPFKRFESQTASYTVVAGDNMTMFDNTGASGAVTFTLPTLANGYFFGFRVVADQNVIVASAAGNDMIAIDDASASSVAFQTTNEKIGGVFWVYSNPGATKWIVENHSAGANTVTVV